MRYRIRTLLMLLVLMPINRRPFSCCPNRRPESRSGTTLAAHGQRLATGERAASAKKDFATGPGESDRAQSIDYFFSTNRT
jgi:hypothetical protein